MSFAELGSLQGFLVFFERHQASTYQILFLGAFFETLIPFSFVVYGELFFLAGAVLAGIGKLDIGMVALVAYSGGVLGDTSSYWLGRLYGPGLFNMLAGWPPARRFLREDVRQKGLAFFHRRGAAAVFFARLCGPFSWFIPALAGTFHLPYARFVLFNTLGVVLGIGEFLLAGYLLGDNLDTIALWLNRLGYMPVAMAIPILAFFLWRRCAGGGKTRMKYC